MRPNRLRQLLKEGKPSIGTHTVVVSPDVVEIIGRAGGIDYVELVAEYGPYTLHDLDNFSRALELYGMTGMIKIDFENRAFTAQRAIGSGVQNVLFADVRTVEDVEISVAAVRAETPQTRGRYGSGDRRFAGYGLESATPPYVQALEDCVIAIMIEKDSAVKNLQAILKVKGVDMIVFGGNDLSMSQGRPGTVGSKESRDIRTHVFKTALKMGVQPRAEINHPDEAAEYLEMGVRHFAIGTDLFMVYEFIKQRGGGLRQLLEKR